MSEFFFGRPRRFGFVASAMRFTSFDPPEKDAATGLLRIVAEFRSFLVTEDRFYGVVDVDYVLIGQQPLEDVLLVSRDEPCVQFAPVSRFERAPYAGMSTVCVTADD